MDNEIKWFLLDLPPINLYTANLLQPYFNGVEDERIVGITQPEDVQYVDVVNSEVKQMIDAHNGNIKKCISECFLDKKTLTCTGCKRTIEEIKQAGVAYRQRQIAAKAAQQRRK